MEQVRILVAEDDPLVLLAVEEALKEAGFEVATATSGSEAIRLISEDEGLIKAVVKTSAWDLVPPGGMSVVIRAQVRRPCQWSMSAEIAQQIGPFTACLRA